MTQLLICFDCGDKDYTIRGLLNKGIMQLVKILTPSQVDFIPDYLPPSTPLQSDSSVFKFIWLVLY